MADGIWFKLFVSLAREDRSSLFAVAFEFPWGLKRQKPFMTEAISVIFKPGDALI